MAAMCGWLMAGAPAMAASDYYLKIDGVDGESSARAATGSTDVLSWSWGTSNAGMAGAGTGGAGAGKVQVQDLSATDAAAVTSPRDAASGQASGKRTHKPVAVADGGTTGATASGAVAAPTMATAMVVVPGPGNATSRKLDAACANGTHFPKAELGRAGERYAMTDVVVSSCTVAGNERRYELKGHVTLIK